MKKKFLSLMMAAAVVATTSVSAFAQEVSSAQGPEAAEGNVQVTTPAENNVQVTTPEHANVTDSDSNSPTQEVQITGHVQNNNGQMPATSFKVTVPTAANFTVTKDGVVVGPELEIKNEGTQAIEVYATNFSKTTNGALKVVKKADLDGKPRSTVALKLTVDSVAKAYLGAGGDKNGVFQDETLNEQVSGDISGDKGKLLTLEAGAKEAKTRKIKIEGTAGKGAVDKAVSDNFELVLKIKKA